MEVSELEVLPPALGAGTSRVFARRHLLRFRHPALVYPGDFLASLGRALGSPPSGDEPGFVLWHRPTGTHFTAHLHGTWAAYGGGLRFKQRPDAAAVSAAYAREHDRRESLLTETEVDPLHGELAGAAPSHAAHTREVERARKLAPRGFFDLLTELEALLERFPASDHRDFTVQGLGEDGAGVAVILARGLENGQYFERQPTVEEAHAALAAKLAGKEERLSSALFEWWSTQTRPPKPLDELGPTLLGAWRAWLDRSLEAPLTGDSSYSAGARARHEEHERAQRWMRAARLALLLPLSPADTDGILSRANSLATQSTEHKKLEKLRRAARASGS